MDSFTLPLKLTCRISGKEVVYTSREYVEKKLAKFGGSLDRLMKEFVCRDAKRLAKEGKGATDIQAEMGTTVTAENGAQITIGAEELIGKIQAEASPAAAAYPKIDFKIGKPQPITKETAGDSCHNPGWFLSHKPCESCAFVKLCNFNRKRVAKK